jgi:fatty acid desaturase
MTESRTTFLIPQSVYAKAVRSKLPQAAFEPDSDKLVTLFLNFMILVLGWIIAGYLDRWPPYLFILYLPFAVIMGNGVIVLLFASHDIMHGSVIRNPRFAYWISLVGLALLWMPPTLWKNVHNRVHHNNTNSLADPDRNFLESQPQNWSKRIQNTFVPSSTVSPLGLFIGMFMSWGVYAIRNTASVLFFNQPTVQFVPSAFTVKRKERRLIFLEFLAILLIHFSIILFLWGDPIKLLLAYFLPIGLGYGGLIFYIYTNHLACPMTVVNDPLVNTISIQVPKLFDILHLNFSYHAEHHIFPGLNSDYYPQVRQILADLYPERMGYVMSAGEAWKLLLSTPRFYRSETTFTDWSGTLSVPCSHNLLAATPQSESIQKPKLIS